jgi:hypothetical protein
MVVGPALAIGRERGTLAGSLACSASHLGILRLPANKDQNASHMLEDGLRTTL